MNNNSDIIKILDHGYVKLIDVFGSDERVEQAARISYEKGTRKTSDTSNLLRYLMRNAHWSPFEMCEVMFEIKAPLFIVQQLLRHRTANINQMSLRYSEAIDEFYHPKWKKQSTDNKQGSGEYLDDMQNFVAEVDQLTAERPSIKSYNSLLNTGVSKELARIVLPASNYTKLVWKCDLRNFMNFLKLRLDHHAQAEIQEMAQAMYDLTKDKFPICFNAFEDYVLNSKTFSAQEMSIVKEIFSNFTKEYVATLAESGNISKREIIEFLEKIK